MILKMRQMMFRNFCVTSFLTVFILLSSCKKTEKVTLIKETKSVLGLLTVNDTLQDFSEVGIKKLSAYNFFKKPLNQLIPVDESVIPYELNSPLFSDYTSKKRFIALPENTKIDYRNLGVLDFPKGTIIIKNFYYTKDDLKSETDDIILETRLLIRDVKTGIWQTLPYVWNEEQTEAYLYILGKDIDLVLEKNKERATQTSFTYSVPNINMCKNCHVKNKKIMPIGPSARQLNRENIIHSESINQLTHLEKNELIHNMPIISKIDKMPNYHDVSSGNVNDRARAYLDVNCAHCHQEGGSAKTSGLHLVYEETDLYKLGLNKPPVAAGSGSGNLSYDVVAGHPEKSILLYRMKNLDPNIMMPEVGKSLVDEKGVKLIEEWIASLE